MSLGFIADVLGMGAKESYADERQEDAQQFNAGEARLQRDWQQHMRSTQYQTAVNDMKAAGLNPMLAYHQGGAGTPTGATATSGTASSGGGTNFASSLQSASATELNNALADKAAAEADAIRKKNPVEIEALQQNIAQSRQLIEKMIQEIKHSESSAANLEQQTRNLREQIPQIQATVRQLQEATKLTIEQARHEWGKADLTHAQMQEIRQRIAANLPEIQRLLHQLETQHKTANLPQAQKGEMVHKDPFLGTLSALMRAFNPLIGIFK